MTAMRKSRRHRLVSVVLATLMTVLITSGNLGAQTTPAATPAGQVTFTKDVAPILQRSCQSCHRPTSIAPMSLLTYEEARPWAKAIKENVVLRNMPPWHIDPNVGINKFANSVALSDEEIATMRSGVPMLHLALSSNLRGGGMSSGFPFGAPESTHFAIVAISWSDSATLFLNS